VEALSKTMQARLAGSAPTFIVDYDARVLAANGAAGALVAPWATAFHFRPAGELLGCLAASEAGCGRGVRCRTCPIRQAVKRATLGEAVHRQPAAIDLVRDGVPHHLELLVSAEPLDENGQRFAVVTVEPVQSVA
jgi:hypothetical protein